MTDTVGRDWGAQIKITLSIEVPSRGDFRSTQMLEEFWTDTYFFGKKKCFQTEKRVEINVFVTDGFFDSLRI